MAALRNYIHVSPYTSGILREFLQHTDDMGEISPEIIPDRDHHPINPLVHPSIANFQGTPLLAHHNPIFTPYNLQPLSHICDSSTSPSLNSTFKYGYELNLVYDLTDSPSVLSGSSSLILNPCLYGASRLSLVYVGAAYDFVEQSIRQEMKNRAETFGATQHDYNAKFTARIGFRTKVQSLMPAIIDHHSFTSSENILSAFSEFKNQKSESVLFLKDVAPIIQRIPWGGDIFAKTDVFGRQDFVGCIKSIIAAVQKISASGRNKLFEASSSPSILYYSHAQDGKMLGWKNFQAYFRFESEPLAKWRLSQNSIPWDVLSTLIGLEEKEQDIELTGRRFPLLPSSVSMHQSVQTYTCISGMFSRSADRRNTRQTQGWRIQGYSDVYQNSHWNSIGIIESRFRDWPKNSGQYLVLNDWASFMENFLGAAIPVGSAILLTKQERLNRKKIFLLHVRNQQKSYIIRGPPHEALDMILALGNVRMPIAHYFKSIYNDSKEKGFEEIKDGILILAIVTKFLPTASGSLTCTNKAVQRKLSVFFLSKPTENSYRNLDNIKLSLMCDSSFVTSQVLASPILMLPPWPAEYHGSGISNLRPRMTVEILGGLGKILPRSRRTIERVWEGASLKQWGLVDIQDYCMTTYFSDLNPYTTSDVIEVADIYDPECRFSEFLGILWEWIIPQLPIDDIDRGLLAQIGNLWLIPIQGGRYRRINSSSEQSVIDPSSKEELGNFLKSLCKIRKNSYATNPLYCSDFMSASATELLRKYKIIRNCDDLEALMDWLESWPDFVSTFCFRERNELITNLGILSARLFRLEVSLQRRSRLTRQIKRLPIFEEIRNTSRAINFNWTSLENIGVTYVAVTIENIIPDIDGVVFLSMRNLSTLQLVKIFGLAEVPEMPQLLDKYILRGISENTTPHIVKKLAVFSLDNIASFPPGAIGKMANMKFVPVHSINDCGVIMKCLKAPRNCVNPRSKLGSFFFAHENVWIVNEFWEAYSTELSRMHLMDSITVELILERVRAYSSLPGGITANKLSKKVKALILASAELQIPAIWKLGYSWLPARGPNGDILVVSPQNCRDESFAGLVGYAMPILPFEVGKTWGKALGWEELIPAVYIKKQIEILVEKKELPGLRIMLDYLTMNDQDKGYMDNLKGMKWIMGVSGELFKPEDIFFTHANRLNPFYDCIDTGLEKQHKSFFQLLGVREKPSFLELKLLVDALDQNVPLKCLSLDLAINALLLAAELYPAENFANFKVPDYTGTLRDLSTLIVGRPKYLEAELFFLNPRIPALAISVLSIPSLCQMQLQDISDTNFNSNVESGQTKARLMLISDNMKRYAIQNTFSEYLANAENLGTATKAGWILDRTENWGETSILTGKPDKAMGPGLFFWNDGTFEEKNFCRLIDIGGGRKESEIGDVGGFGSGILTMYHWTSLPQIVSGEFFVFLDPEEKYLPLNHHTKRRHASLKIRLRKMQKHYPDHLAPFHGILGFGPGSSYLQGTIFRFPFRKPGCPSSLVPGSQVVDVGDALALMRDYFKDAKISLLFLTRIVTIEFGIRGIENPEWRVSGTRTPAEKDLLGGTTEQLFVESRQFAPASLVINDEWRLAYRRFPEASLPKSLKPIQKEYKLQTRCGIAALISHQYDHLEFDGQFFTVLPSRWSSKLPVHIYAPLIVAGSKDLYFRLDNAGDTGSEWNLWIIEHEVVSLYLCFLQYLAQSFGGLAFKFWPHRISSDSLSGKLCKEFWRKIPKTDLKLFAVDEHEQKSSALDLNSIRVGQSRNRSTLALNEAVFNFLDHEKRSFFHFLLHEFGAKNIVSPTDVMSKALRDLGGITKIDPPYISSLLRGNPKNNALQNIWAADEFCFSRLGPFLKFMMQPSRGGFAFLKGCQILPLADLTLGTLDDLGTCRMSRYYISREGMMNLFDFAPSLAIHSDLPRAITSLFLKLNLNVSILPPSDLPRIFKNVGESQKTSMTFHRFLLKFWISVRHEYEGQPEYDIIVFLKLPIHSTTINGLFRAISPEEFEALPAIVSPDEEREFKMCSKLSGLYLVDQRTVSTAMQKAEKLTKPVGLMRFIDALGKLAKLKHQTPKAFLSLWLGREDITFLRELVTAVISEDILRKHSTTIVILKSLKLWPTMSGKLVCSLDALLAPDPRFCVTWIKCQQLVIEPKASQKLSRVLKFLEVQRPEAQKFISSYCQDTLDQKLGVAELDIYRGFMEAYLCHIGELPPNSPFALDGNCCFRPPQALYDHCEPIFVGAFRGAEKNYFLHPNLRHLRNWFMPGLRSEISGSDYYKCATHIRKRSGLSEPLALLETDATTVFRYLCHNQDFFQHWSSADLQRIQGVRFVPLLRQFSGEARYRKGRMQHISNTAIFGNLKECVDAEYLGICWSQCPIYAKSPSAYILGQTPSNGAPSTQIILQHVSYLATHRNEVRGVRDIQLFVKDILTSYKFLNDHCNEKKYAFEKVRSIDPRVLDTILWLNLDEPITDANINLFETSWASTKDLCLGIRYDFGRYRFVRRVLADYEQLLQALEVETVQKLMPESTTLGVPQTNNIRENLFNFWQQGKFCDVELEISGMVFKAHRVMLASSSSYWEDIFVGNWAEADGGRISIKGTTLSTVSAMLYFLYAGELPSTTNDTDPGKNLEHMMDWLIAADRWYMSAFKDRIERAIVQQNYLRPENVRQILGIAREAQAQILSKCCEVYIQENRKFVERIDYAVM